MYSPDYKSVSVIRMSGQEIHFTFPELTGIRISIGIGASHGIAIMVGNDTCPIVGIMPNPEQAKISGAWCIWLQNSCASIEVMLC